MNFLITFISLIFLATCGYGVIRMITKEDLPFSLFGMIPLSFGVGIAALGIWCNLLMLLGLDLSFMTVNTPLFVIFIFAITQMSFTAKINAHDIMDILRGISWKEWVLILIAAFGIISIFLMSISFPMHFQDSRAIWGAKAKMLFFSGTVHSSAFTDAYRINAHPRYPLLFPLSEAYIYMSLGRADDWAVMLLTGILFPFIVIFLYDLARVYLRDREKALIAAAMVAVLPVFYLNDGTAYSGYADIPLSFLYILSFGLALIWRTNKRTGWLVLCALLSGALFITKNEGINLIMLNLLLILIPEKFSFSKEDIIDAGRAGSIFLAVVAVVVVPWMILVRSILFAASDANDVFQIGFLGVFKGLGRLPFILSYTARAFMGIQKNMLGQVFVWAGLWYIFLFTALISFWQRSRGPMTLFWIVFFNIVFISLGYVVFPTEPSVTIESNFFRIYLAITPVIALQIASTLASLEHKNTQN